MLQTIIINETIAENVQAEISFTAPGVAEIGSFLKIFERVDFKHKFFESIPILKIDAEKHGVDFNVKFIGPIYSWRLWILRLLPKIYDLVLRIRGEENYRALYG